MQAWIREILDEPMALATIYAALILLVILWALALLTRRLRVVQSELETVRAELRVINEAVKLVQPGGTVVVVDPPAPAGQPAQLSDDELASLPPVV